MKTKSAAKPIQEKDSERLKERIQKEIQETDRKNKFKK
jgi:hypothetical protein